MTTTLITPNSVQMNPADVNPHAQTAQIMTVAKATGAFQKAEEKAKSDSVNISKEALRMAKKSQDIDDEPKEDSEPEPEADLQEKV
jgi:hypothetical protein